MHTKFPVYRKYSNNKNYFKIISDIEFEELQLIGNKIFVHIKKAELYPDKLLIQDLINGVNESVIEITEEEYNSLKK